jgi:hypothetical protein
MGLQPLENKALSWGIIGESAPTLAEITIRKSQGKEFEVIGDKYRCFAKGRRVEIPERSFIRPWCVFRAKVATDSGRTLPPIPGEGCH